MQVKHYGAFNDKTSCGKPITARIAFTAQVDEVTCKGCGKTDRFQNAHAAHVKAVKAFDACQAAATAWVGTGEDAAVPTTEDVPLGRPVTVAPLGTPCGWTAYGETGTRLTCQAGRDAVHILTVTLPVAQAGTALCGYHSPWDVTEADRAAQAEGASVDDLRRLASQAPMRAGDVFRFVPDGQLYTIKRFRDLGYPDAAVIFECGDSLFMDRMRQMIREGRLERVVAEQPKPGEFMTDLRDMLKLS